MLFIPISNKIFKQHVTLRSAAVEEERPLSLPDSKMIAVALACLAPASLRLHTGFSSRQTSRSFPRGGIFIFTHGRTCQRALQTSGLQTLKCTLCVAGWCVAGGGNSSGCETGAGSAAPSFCSLVWRGCLASLSLGLGWDLVT